MSLKKEIDRLQRIMSQIEQRMKPTTPTAQLISIFRAAALCSKTVAMLLLANDRLQSTTSDTDYEKKRAALLEMFGTLEKRRQSLQNELSTIDGEFTDLSIESSSQPEE